MPQKRPQATKILPLGFASRQHWTDLRGSHPLPIQWHFIWNIAAELWENVSTKIHPVSDLLLHIAKHEAHLHLHCTSVLLLPPQALLLWVF